MSRYEVSVWAGLMAPAGTRTDIVALLNGETREAVKDLGKRFAEMDAVPAPSTPAEFAAYLRNEIAKWGPVVKRSGARVD